VTSRSLLPNTSVKGGELRSLGFPLEVWIENDAPTFNTAHLAGLVFLLRDGVGDQATMCTVAGLAHREGLWGLSCFIEIHDAPQVHT
jgi:hypothetical protein